jgi:hypothetical protein
MSVDSNVSNASPPDTSGRVTSTEDKGVNFSRAWQIYDEHRTALFHALFFESKVSQIQIGGLYLDIIIAVGTSSTGIAGWALWNEPRFKFAWVALAGVAGTLTIIKPILHLDDKWCSTRNFSRITAPSRDNLPICSAI